ncbi:transposase [Kitasatospora nipponensis]|uniref:transposase n=1 Tax=Kitasatospora nipponensis TaxID=258049 RepID=UPI0031D54076
MTNSQRVRLEPVLPQGKTPGWPPPGTRRQWMDGIRWRTRTGVAWRDLPERHGPAPPSPSRSTACAARRLGRCRPGREVSPRPGARRPPPCRGRARTAAHGRPWPGAPAWCGSR